MSEWHPIDTAPRGLVLLYFPTVIVGAYQQSTLHERMIVDMADGFPNRPPTHWMPLPAPPSTVLSKVSE